MYIYKYILKSFWYIWYQISEEIGYIVFMGNPENFSNTESYPSTWYSLSNHIYLLLYRLDLYLCTYILVFYFIEVWFSLCMNVYMELRDQHLVFFLLHLIFESRLSLYMELMYLAKLAASLPKDPYP